MAKREELNKVLLLIRENPDCGMKKFYNDYGRFIYAVAFSVTKKQHLADEAVNEIMFRVWKFSAKLGKSVNEGWLYVLCVNAAKTVIKRNFFVPIKNDCSYVDKQIANIENDGFFEYLSFVNSLERKILIFRFVDEYSFEEIAGVINKKLSTVTSAYYRALKKIEKGVKKDGR